MRAFLLVVLVTCCGCTGSRNSQRTGDTPVIMENAKISERLRVSQQQQDEQDATARLEVSGNVTR
jgi:uncharacterized protein YcfL